MKSSSAITIRAFTIDKDFEAVTAADIQRVAKKYFTENNRTVATLIPDAAQGPARRRGNK